MSISKSKCRYSNNCLDFLRCAVPLLEYQTLVDFFYFFLEQPNFPRIIRLIEYFPIHWSLKEIAVHAGHEVLIVVDLHSSNCWDPQGILDQYIKPHPICLLGIIFIVINFLMRIFPNKARNGFSNKMP